MRLLLIFLLLCCQCAVTAESLSLPDWRGVWERFELNGGIFDLSTVEPKDGRAGSPGVRQYPPLTDAWEAKYRANLAFGRHYDYACSENNRNPITDFGQTLTLDSEGETIDLVIDTEQDN